MSRLKNQSETRILKPSKLTTDIHKNILIFPSWYVLPDNPISGIFFREQALALQRNGLNVYVLDLQVYGGIRKIIQYLFRVKKCIFYNDHGVKTYHVNYLDFYQKFSKMGFLKCAAFYFRKYFKNIEKENGIRFDIVHIHSAIYAGIIYCLSGIKTKYVITEHTTLYSEKRIPVIFEKYLEKVFFESRAIIAVGNGLKKNISVYTRKPIDVIFNIVFMSEYNPRVDASKKKYRFFALGLSIYQKGFDILISAFKNISIFEYCELYIAGLNLDECKILENQALSEGVDSSVKIRGLLSREEVAYYMYNCDCFVMPSRFETFGVVFAEAMYFGKPVIASITGGPDSFVTPETGILIPVENISETTKALEYMFYNKTRYNANTIKNYAMQTFSEEKIIGQILEKYDDVV